MTLEATDILFGYRPDRMVIRRASLRVEDGDMLCIVGPNGSGKSTFLRLLSGALRPTSGAVTLNGQNLLHVPKKDLARSISFLPQDPSYAFDYLVEEIVAMGRYPHLGPFEWGNGPHSKAVRKAMAMTDVDRFLGRPYGELSGGEKQMVNLAKAFAQEPTILILDEPTRDLDLSYSHMLLRLVKRLNTEKGLTIITVLHDIAQAMRFFPRMVLFDDGVVRCVGRPTDVITPASMTDVFGVSVSVDHENGNIRVLG